MDKVVVKDQRLSELKCKLANDLAALCKPGLVFYLYGNVGSGKTTLVRAILQNLGCSQKVQSPSYAIIEKDETIQLSTVLLGSYYNKLISNNYSDITRYLNDSIINVDKEKRVFKVRVKKGIKKIKIKGT